MKDDLTENEIEAEIVKIINSKEFRLELVTCMTDAFENYVINDDIGCKLWIMIGLDEEDSEYREILKQQITQIEIDRGSSEDERIIW